MISLLMIGKCSETKTSAHCRDSQSFRLAMGLVIGPVPFLIQERDISLGNCDIVVWQEKKTNILCHEAKNFFSEYYPLVSDFLRIFR